MDKTLDDIFYKIRSILNPPFYILEIQKSKKNINNYAIKIDGGSCNHIRIGSSALLYSQSNLYKGKGEVARNSSCRYGWIMFEKLQYPPLLSDKITIPFY